MPNNSRRSRNNSQRSNNVIQATFIDEPQIIIGETVFSEDDKKEQIRKLNEKMETLNKKLTNMKKENEKKENCILKYKREVKKLKEKNNELNTISTKYDNLVKSTISMKNSVDIMKTENDNLLKRNTYLIKRYRNQSVLLNKEVEKVCYLNETLEKENIDLKKLITDIKNKWANEIDMLEK
jgi:chromosome segregation ATPase